MVSKKVPDSELRFRAVWRSSLLSIFSTLVGNDNGDGGGVGFGSGFGEGLDRDDAFFFFFDPEFVLYMAGALADDTIERAEM